MIVCVKSASYAMHRAAAATLECSEKAGAGHKGGSNLPARQNQYHMVLTEILPEYAWLRVFWWTVEDLEDWGVAG